MKGIISSFIIVSIFIMVMFFPSPAASAESAAATMTACDNFGREWTITYDTAAKTIRGCRDKNNELGCGCLPVYGVLSGSKFGMSSLDTVADSCVSTYWEGDWLFGSGSGNVYNESGFFGSFTLTPCAGAVGATGATEGGADPAQ